MESSIQISRNKTLVRETSLIFEKIEEQVSEPHDSKDGAGQAASEYWVLQYGKDNE